MAPPPLKAIITALIITASLFYLFHQHEPPLLTASKPPSPNNKTIPNLVNLVYLVPSETSDVAFEFSHFLCAYAARHHLGPTSHLVLHTNADAASLARARAGQSGKWARLLLDLPGLRVRHVVSPNATTTDPGAKPLRFGEHRSDFVRVAAAREFGGLYIDFDVFVLRDLRPLREAGFGAVVGREVTDQVNSGVFLTRPNSLLITRWEESMPRVYDGEWVTHSNVALTRISETLVSESPGSVLIMERNAFNPGGWRNEDYDGLWGTHDDDDDDDDKGWELDYSRTYMLHAFMPYRARHPVHGFDRLLPRYVLERRSNFARALYPVVSVMLEDRLVDWNDTFDGR
ncbi:hypothetical protein CDD80_6967 [Ophiocordyceps camponoti-rufipedis]|uniref:Alpha 1,4-glycosyltransferase domain-containing protein n=1 Tax=Ophiocordyceps camponoti-rufipedis TaxID=2004952 RepID=A0A2C5YI37_9HYPO|nr:hypothetical protein CDD80_6967 [Ophiocordyceps camponoti-rufipedis]